MSRIAPTFKRIKSHRDLEVYQIACDTAMELFELSKKFPKEETYSLTDQVRRSSRSVAANIVEAWRKRRYPLVFVNKLSDSETEAAETQVWLEFAVKCGYLNRSDAAKLYRSYDSLIAKLVGMITHADKWAIKPPRTTTGNAHD
jgi:four helix bundle protein